MPESVFIETSIPSYLVADRSRDIVQMARQELTNEWWNLHRHKYDLFCSQIVLDEVGRGDPEMARQRLNLLEGLPLLDIDEEVTTLAKELLRESIVPKKAADDAFHIACSGVHRMDFLLTWTANTLRIRKFSEGSAHVSHGVESTFL